MAVYTITDASTNNRSVTDINANDIVLNLEMIIPNNENNVDDINMTINRIVSSGFYPINNEIHWYKDSNDRNVLRIFGALEGRITISDLIDVLDVL